MRTSRDKARKVQAIVEGGENTALQCSRAHDLDRFFSKLRTAREEMPEKETQHLEPMEKQFMEAIRKFMEAGTGSQE